MSSYYRQQLEEWLATLEVRADTVLDIGGKQGEVKGRVRHWDVGEYKVLDLPEFDIEQSSDAYTLRQDAIINPAGADIIFCLEVFEYLIRPGDALFSIKKLLKNDGVAYITIPLVYPVHNEIELDSLRYTENGFKRLCESVGIKAEVVKYRVDKSGLLQAFYSADKMHPAKGIEHNVTGYIFEVTK